MNLGNTLWKLGEWDEALAHFRKNLELSETDGDLSDQAVGTELPLAHLRPR